MGKNFSEFSVEFSTLVELLRWRAIHQSQQKAYSFLLDGEVEEFDLTYGELDEQARQVGALLQSCGVIGGERALLLYPPGLEFIAAFFGCLYAGVIAVPVYPPRVNQSLSRLQAVVGDAKAVVALCTTTVLSNIEQPFAQYPNLQALPLLTTDNIIQNDLAQAWQEPSVNTDTLAFLQYTSGSTGTPKGVMVSHGNLLHNEFLIKQAMQHTTETLFVGWLPLFHDMGLVGNVLQPLYLGIPSILMSPIAFLQKPFRWLQAISRYKATTSGGPNFAYDLCVQKITSEQRAILDLSSWEIAFNGAEPVRGETVDLFAATFAECGFRREAFYPCYGMAETTLIVSGGLKAVPPVLLPVQSAALAQNQVIPASPQEFGPKTLVGCGQPLEELTIAIVHPETLTNCHSHEVGEIWVAGKSVAKGYWNQLEQTEQTFQAYLKDTGVGPFLRTGDLGFLREGELFITGRLKDLIIIRGQNHYPQDIEWTVEQSHPALQPGGSAAFSIDVGGERLVIVTEIKRSYRRNLNIDEVIAAIRSRVAENHELQLYAVSLLKTGCIPKTSSGKIQRYACRSAFLAGSLESIGSNILNEGRRQEAEGRRQLRWDLMNPHLIKDRQIENQEQKLVFYLHELVARILKVALEQVNPQQPLSALGLDSLMAIEIKHSIETNLGVVLPITSFMSASSINRLAVEVLAQLTLNLANPSPQELRDVVDGENSVITEYPLSYGQQALYFLYRLAPESPTYNIAKAARISSDLNIKALHRAFQTLLERHSCLRTTFSTVDGKPIQRVHKGITVCFQQEDAATWDEEFLSDRLITEAYRPFNLEQGSLLRVSLFTRSPQENILLLVVHHIVADLWSLTVLMDELGMLYQAENNATPVTLPNLTWQYADYVQSASQRLASTEGAELLLYWQKQLAGKLPVLNLPTDRPRPPVQTYNGASISCKLSRELSQKLLDFSRDRGVTLYMTLLAAFQVLLYRYTNQEDLLLGSPTTGRSRADLAELVGYFVNPVVCRADLSGNPTFEEFLNQVRSTVLDALAHQDYPFARLVEQLQPMREPSRSPLFQVMFVLQKAHLHGQEGLATFALEETGARIKLGDLELESIALNKRIAQFDLTLMIAEVDEVLSSCWEYNTDLFDATTVERLAGHFQTLLENIVIDSQQHVSLLPFLTKLEWQQLLIEWNATQVNYASEPCLHKQFETQVEQTPDAVVVVFKEEQLTYAQLNQQANQLAHYLQTSVEPEVLVGIYLERSVEMVVSILAVLKAGGAYVPLDPTYPKERIAFMLEDAQVSVLLTQQKFLDALPEHKAQVVFLEKSEVWAVEKVENPVSQVTSNNLAYVIYTSGSTGKPKGVMNTHSSICNRLFWMQQTYQLTTADRVLQKTPFSFDVSIWEFFWPLLTGASLVMAEPGGHQDSAYLVKLIAQQQITTIHFVPSMLQVFLEFVNLEASTSLRQVMCSGEALSLNLQQRFFAQLDAELHNLYGPTEAAIDVTFFWCRQNISKYTVPIGRPIANTQIYLLDAHLQPVPIGVPGEVHISGVALARGYLNQPELTALKFIPNPFSDQRGARLYKTGDLARYQLDGSIEYLGRKDYQVKLRGFRIELAEIETVLGQHPAVREVVVLMRKSFGEGRREFALNADRKDTAITSLRHFLKGEFTEELATEPAMDQMVAYCVCHQPAPTTTELRRFLHKKLPDYMIPAAFIMLDALPLTPNGKIDRQALPTPGKVRPELEKAFVAPSTDVEKVLAEVWASVLGLEQVGIHDNFFELGGDSIRTIQVVAKAQVRGLSFSVQEIYESQNIYKLAQIFTLDKPSFLPIEKTEVFSLISEAERQKLPSDIVDAYPLARVQAGIIFHSEYSPDSLMYHDIFQYHLRVRLNMELLQRALQQLVERHPILRTSFDLTNYTEPLQLVHQNVFVPLQVEDLRSLEPNLQQQAIATWIETEKNRRFDLTYPPLIRFFVHRLTEHTFYLTLSWHNSILDGWSQASLLTELLHCYCALIQVEVYSKESPPKTSYRDFVAEERKILASPEYLAYWTQKLKGSITTKLPRWLSTRPATDKSQIGVLDVPISSEVSNGLKKLARLAEVPLKNVLLAAHLRVMNLLSGESDILTGLESNSRLEEADAEKTLGSHINTVPFRLKLTVGTWIDLAKQAFAAEQELLAFRRYPYSSLQKLSGRQPLQSIVETVFNYTHFHVYQSLKNLKGIEILGGQGFGESNFTLRVEFNRNHISDHIQLDLECKLADISHAQLEAIGSYFIETLTAMATQPFERYEEKCLLSATEQHQLLVEWNNTASEYPQQLCIHQLFEQQVQQNSNANALIFEQEQLSYQELNSRANALAEYLRQLGVSPETRVALCVERSLEMIVGILGILKAGGAYVPLDPTYPQNHLAFVLEDAQVSILLTQARLVARLPTNGTQILCLDSDWNVIAKSHSENPICKVTQENLAYVIYTSGSTGCPKGVQVTHQNLVHSTSARINYYLEPVTSFLLVPSFAFDSSVAAIFWTLCQGGTLIVLKNNVQKDIWQLAKLIAQHQVSHWLSIPSLYNALLAHVELIDLMSLRTVIVAGESCSKELVELHQKLLPQTSLFNEYGPTEATVWSSVYNCQNHDFKTAVPIGRAIANTQIYLLNSYKQPVPIGVPGELYIGGLGLTRGYLNCPELTTEKFIPNPFSDRPNARLYKTGDLARILPNGNIEFLGRIDNQVKLRGYRIELTAIEMALQEHPIVKEAVVSVRKDDSDNQRLIAYVVCKSTLKTEELKRELRQKLPEYMIPTTFMILDALPLMPNGKVDRQNLPAPEQMQFGDKAMAQILSRLEVLSEEEVKAMLQHAKTSQH